MLKMENITYYKVKTGQTLGMLAKAFCVSEGRLVELNHLTEELFAGQILKIPTERGNSYVVQEGDTKELLCGSKERFCALNGTDHFYIGMRVII
jgi:LysM repeat protein